jgi:hypothetical protein
MAFLNEKLTAAQDLVTAPAADVTTSGTIADLANAGTSYQRLTAATQLTSLVAADGGKEYTLVNANSVAVLVKHLSGTAGNQIDTGTGLDYSLPAGGQLVLKYDITGAVWRIVSAPIGSLKPTTQSIATAAGTTSLTNASPNLTIFTGSTTQICQLPDVTTCVVGQIFSIANQSSSSTVGAVTISLSTGTVLTSLSTLNSVDFQVVSTASNVAGAWKQTGNNTEIISIDNWAASSSTASGASINATSLSIPPGQWDLVGNAYFIPAPANSMAIANLSISTTSATIAFDANVKLSAVGVSPFFAYTPTFTGFGTVTDVNVFAKLEGTKLKIWGTFTNGVVAASLAKISLPSGLTVNTSAYTNGKNLLGYLEENLSTNQAIGSTGVLFAGSYSQSDTGNIYLSYRTDTVVNGQVLLPENGTAQLTSLSICAFQFEVEVSGAVSGSMGQTQLAVQSTKTFTSTTTVYLVAMADMASHPTSTYIIDSGATNSGEGRFYAVRKK